MFAVILVSLILVFGGLHDGLKTDAYVSLTLSQKTAVFLAAVLVFEIAALLALWRGLPRQGMTLRDLGLQRGGTTFMTGMGLATAIAYILLTLAAPSMHVREHLGTLDALKLFGVVVGTVAGVVEEIVFRGYVITILNRRGWSPRARHR